MKNLIDKALGVIINKVNDCITSSSQSGRCYYDDFQSNDEYPDGVEVALEVEYDKCYDDSIMVTSITMTIDGEKVNHNDYQINKYDFQ